MTDCKPLPELPISSRIPNLTRLSVQSRQHRERFIRFALSELDDLWLDNNLEDWIQVLEYALDDLGSSLDQGQWLSGIKKGKIVKRLQPKNGTLDAKLGSDESSNDLGKSKVVDEFTSDNGLMSSDTHASLSIERLRQLREAVAKSDVPTHISESTHLLLCLAPLGSQIPPEENSGFDLIPSNAGCSFRSGFFIIPEESDSKDRILYGMHEWDTSAKETSVCLVGGTFALKGVPSIPQYRALAKALKLSIYVHLSLLLEQQLLVNSHVQLTFAQPPVRIRTHSSNNYSQLSPIPSQSNPSNAALFHKSRNILSSGILSFFSKRNFGRTPSTREDHPVQSSLDSVPFPSVEQETPVRSSLDDMSAAARLRRFSFLSTFPNAPESRKESTSSPYSTTLSRVEAQKNVLSSSVGVVFDPPVLLVRLAEKEKAHPDKKIHLMGDERVALKSLLGWGTVDNENRNDVDSEKDNGNGNEFDKGRGMAGIPGFVNQQEISVLVSSHIPLPGACVPRNVGPEASMSASTSSMLSLPREASSASQNSESSDSSSATPKPKPSPTHTSCEQPHWTLYRYYDTSKQVQTPSKDDYAGNAAQGDPGSRKEDQDRCLGQVITSWIDEADVPCSRLRTVPSTSEPRGIGIMHGLGGSASTTTEKRCEVPVGKHERRFVHGGVKVSAKVEWPALEKVVASTSASSNTAFSADENHQVNIDDREQTNLYTRVITMWESCLICGAETKKNELSDGAYLFSFAKYLELLIYSPLLCKLSPKLCEHTDTSPTSPPSTSFTSSESTSSQLPPQRFNIVRHFSTSSHEIAPIGISDAKGVVGNRYTVSFQIDPVEDIFELRVPRLQISPWGLGGEGDTVQNHITSATTSADTGMVAHKEERNAKRDDDEKKRLRKEIKAWWEGVADFMDSLEEKFSAEDQVTVKKALPRLPSTDDAYDSFDDDNPSEPEEHPTPKPNISGLPESSTPIVVASTTDYFGKSKASSPISVDSFTPSSSTSSTTINPLSHPPLNHATSSTSQCTVTTATSGTSSSASSVHSTVLADPMELLSNLRQTFHRIEQTLYTQLARTPPSSLNEVRRAFLSAARGAERRLIAWQKKHTGRKNGKKQVRDQDGNTSNESNPSEKLRVAEPEWWNSTCHIVPSGNIIIREDDWGSIIAFTLSSPDYCRELASISANCSSSNADIPSTSTTSASSFFSAATATGYKLFRTSALVQPDPDQEDIIWHEPEAFSAVISRKEHPRDPSSLLSIREVLRQKTPDSNISRFASQGSSTWKGGGDRPPLLPDGVPPSAWAKPDVQVNKQEAAGEVVSGLSNGNDNVHRLLHELDTVETNTESRRDLSVLGSYPWTTSDASTIKQDSCRSSINNDATVSLNDTASRTDNNVDANAQDSLSPTVSTPSRIDIASPLPASSSLSSFTNGITNAMRLMIPSHIPRPRSAGSNGRHHGLLSAEANAIDERPHIKYDWTIGKRLKFSCTVYYAKQFDNLRKRCGVDSVFLESLSRSANWSAEGGKSKSNFWKTADDRFIIKTLVNAWNVADLQVLIELSPSYFRYMESTISKPTVLAKLIGFYTIEIRNLETGTVQSKADLLVMENLFYDQKIDKTFDLKGIQGRKVKAGNNVTGQTSRTLFDGEWIEGQQQTLTLVRPYSKAILREAIRSDADFLSKSNIMDYSLLLGVDTENKQIACGLVDTIGSYTFAKTLEYKAKQGLNSRNGKEVTVIPPAEYQERFINALEKYFLACPEKWSKPLDERKAINNLDLLPSVL